ncbi:MAG: hypothetical protein HZA90_05295 [Verrucomicrobia bacterium]|nr:hypothetical protein [Verrucomicrobiota bacterium]
MTPPATSRLNELSQRFTALLFARFSELERHVVAPRDFQHDGDLYIEFPCPFPTELQWPLCIWTERGREVSIGLDACHTHFTCSRDAVESDIFAEALAFLDDIFAERIVVISFVSDGRLAGSSFHPPEEIEAEIAQTPPGILVRVRSWRGTYLRDHAA